MELMTMNMDLCGQARNVELTMLTKSKFLISQQEFHMGKFYFLKTLQISANHSYSAPTLNYFL